MENRQGSQKASSQTSGGNRSRGITPTDQLLVSVLRLLAIRPRSVAEITKYLTTKTSDLDLINQIIDSLKAQHLLDDQKFATWLIESRSRHHIRGKMALARELQNKGVESSLVDLSGVNEVDLAIKAATSKSISWRKLPYRDFKLKLGRFLQYRGFSWSVVESAAKSLYNGSDVDN